MDRGLAKRRTVSLMPQCGESPDRNGPRVAIVAVGGGAVYHLPRLEAAFGDAA